MEIFHLKEANDLIPTVTSLVELLLQNHEEIQKVQLEHETARFLRSNEGGEAPRLCAEIRRAEERLHEHFSQRDKLLSALQSVGCILHCIHTGTVHFPALHEDRLIYFCWRHVEPCIQYWHEKSGGEGTKRLSLRTLFGGCEENAGE